MSKPIEIQKNTNKWEIINWFSYFKYDNGIITCRFDKRLKPYLLDIKKLFLISDLRMILPIRSSYSKRIYLLLKEYEYDTIGYREFQLSELQEILKVPKSFKIFNRFKEKVLFKAKEDINKFTDLQIDFIEKKLAKKVVSIKFIIKKSFITKSSSKIELFTISLNLQKPHQNPNYSLTSLSSLYSLK